MTLDPASIEAAARRLLTHRAEQRPIPVPQAALRVADISTAYAIQDAADRILRGEQGWRGMGWKIGASSPAARAMLGIDAPFFGRLYDRLVAASPARLPVSVLWCAHEPEIALRLGRDLDPAQAPFDAAMIEAATAAVLPSIEVVGTVFAPFMDAGGPALAADNGAFGFWVMGAERADWSDLDLLGTEVRLLIDGAVRATGRGGAVAGGCFAATAGLATILAAQGHRLRAGDYVTTGTVTAPVGCAPGQSVVAEFGPLGRVVLQLDPA